MLKGSKKGKIDERDVEDGNILLRSLRRHYRQKWSTGSGSIYYIIHCLMIKMMEKMNS